MRIMISADGNVFEKAGVSIAIPTSFWFFAHYRNSFIRPVKYLSWSHKLNSNDLTDEYLWGECDLWGILGHFYQFFSEVGKLGRASPKSSKANHLNNLIRQCTNLMKNSLKNRHFSPFPANKGELFPNCFQCVLHPETSQLLFFKKSFVP